MSKETNPLFGTVCLEASLDLIKEIAISRGLDVSEQNYDGHPVLGKHRGLEISNEGYTFQVKAFPMPDGREAVPYIATQFKMVK